MTQKLALTAASAAAALTLAVAVAATGFVSRTESSPARPTPARPTAAATPTIVVDTIYVAPPPPQQTITVHKVASTAGESDDGNESGGED